MRRQTILARLLLTVFLSSTLTLAQPAQRKPVQTVEISNSLLAIKYDKSTLTWTLSQHSGGAWQEVMRDVTSVLTFRGRDSLSPGDLRAVTSSKREAANDAIGKGERLIIRSEAEEMIWTTTLTIYDGKALATISGTLQNKSKAPLRPKEFRLVEAMGASALTCYTDTVLMHVNGYQSWSNIEVVRLDSAARQTSFWSTVFYEPSVARSLLVGFLTNSASTNSIRVEPFHSADQTLPFRTASDIKTVEIATGAEWRSDTLLLAFDQSPLHNLTRYGEYLQAFAPAIPKPFTPNGREPVRAQGGNGVPSGWCSWYYYYQHISEDSILQNLNVAAGSLKNAGLQYIQIDDGFQLTAGDWDVNEKFPHGHKWLTDRIHEKGFRAGVWIAPFAIAESSTVYKQHRDWLLRDENDSLKEFFANDWWGGRIYSLDPSHPEAQGWLQTLFAKIINEWNYDYVKIDFLYFAGEGGRYHKPVSSMEAYQEGLRAIREGVGSDKFILGCGAPIGSSIGYVDGMRIGQDVYAGWGGITPGVNAAAQRYFYHNAVWYNDPDCLVVREPLTTDQARVWAGVVALSGQMNLLSDKLPDLPRDRIDLLKQTLPVYGTSALPLDLFSPPKEQGLTLRSSDGAMTLALPGQWRFTTGDSMLWKEPAFDDSDWRVLPVPARWENTGFPEYDGFAWYRAKFTLPKNWKRGPITFIFAKIDDSDETYLNGSPVGATGTMPPEEYRTEWTAFRIYTLPENLVNWEGENTLAVRVYDGGGAGGIFSIKQFQLPMVWNVPVEKPFGGWNVVGVFNWSSTEEASVSLSPELLGIAKKQSYIVYDLWSERIIEGVENAPPLRLAPTSSALLAVHEKQDRPFVLSTSRSLVQGANDIADVVWDAARRSLKGISINILTGEPYSIVMYIPTGMTMVSVFPAENTTQTPLGANAVKITFEKPAKEKMGWSVEVR